jgi:hypothetical protein
VIVRRGSFEFGKKKEPLMERLPSGTQRRDATRPTTKVEATTAKVEAALASREEAAKIRRRLLMMIVENEQKRRSQPSTTSA